MFNNLFFFPLVYLGPVTEASLRKDLDATGLKAETAGLKVETAGQEAEIAEGFRGPDPKAETAGEFLGLGPKVGIAEGFPGRGPKEEVIFAKGVVPGIEMTATRKENETRSLFKRNPYPRNLRPILRIQDANLNPLM